ncbi:cyclodeaminase/cyclohydrolase family protein [Anaerosinus massiliensis]|uniref:cyclodeaminase/cyclohydrolase family protein n=1 Tax=Massilibacillus massiliensis TaxID=1806837 RepID=UPI0018FF005B|nr:cyclodeaminase/cyclohydrolase family protein [Massilibacillus massiliensis]
MLTDLSLHHFFSKMAGNEAPGSGSGAALLGLTGVSLLKMVNQLCDERESGEVTLLNIELDKLHVLLGGLINRDAEVLNQALPALTAVGADGNSQEWNEVLLQAIDVPYAIADACLQALEAAKKLRGIAKANLICDVQFAAMSCNTAIQGAILIAQLNISLLRDDEELAAELKEKVEQFAESSDRFIDAILL